MNVCREKTAVLSGMSDRQYRKIESKMVGRFGNNLLCKQRQSAGRESIWVVSFFGAPTDGTQVGRLSSAMS
jgi:hypothetical protein